MIARINPLNPPYREEEAEALKKMMPPNAPSEALALFRILAKNLDLMSRMRPLGAGLLGHGLIDPREREVVILRTCAKTGAEYEWGVHATAFGKMVGLSKDEIALTLVDTGTWSERESTLINMVDELHATSKLSDTTWENLEAFWDEAQILELLVLIGWYHTISFLCNATQVPLEAWAARFSEA